MKRIGILIWTICIGTICGCGGGGGGNSSPSFAGVYRVSLLLSTNTCGPGFDSVLTLTHNVNQDGQNIALDSGRAVFTGSVNVDGDGFTVTRPAGDGLCDIQQAIAYSASQSGEAEFAVALVQQQECSDGGLSFSCELVYLGVADS